MRSRAILSNDGSHYLINAKKSWITSGPVAKYVILFAQTQHSDGSSLEEADLGEMERRWQLAKEHDLGIEARSRVGRGSRFSIAAPTPTLCPRHRRRTMGLSALRCRR